MSNHNLADPMLAILTELKVMSSLLADVKEELQDLRKATERQTLEMRQQATMPSRIRG